ncbi:Vegetative incompatibility protein HET-E-1 [Metarhizium anisopliae]|nr:Vegetative incompatibility protein HET-E-1 [Metarhizium anisopliae]
MKLINVESGLLEEFVGAIPHYAILSHTWGEDEVIFQDFVHSSQEARRQKKGFAKILKTCELAKRSGLKYAWVDTCCIDKSSSAELSEAINSMFRWYRGATVCYAWLTDLLPDSSLEPDTEALRGCRWFKRGWTLQELIAPRAVEFYDANWNFRGSKSGLKYLLTDITKVPGNVLESPESLYTLSVARRMSWVSERRTTRIEDMAYCLLGIFDVSMPLLYGEGDRAFLRLQEEISNSTNDLSIFAWRKSLPEQIYYGVYATSPADFRESGTVELVSSTMFMPEFLRSNKGLRIHTSIFHGSQQAYLLKLQCVETSGNESKQIGIWIKPHGGGLYSRIRAGEFGAESAEDTSSVQLLFLFRHISPARSRELQGSHSNALMIRKGINTKTRTTDESFPFEVTMWLPQDEWDSQRSMFMNDGAAEFAAYGYFNWRQDVEPTDDMHKGHSFMLILGKMADESEPWISLASLEDTTKNLTAHMGDATKMVAASRKFDQERMLVLRDIWRNACKAVYVSLEKSRVDGEEVYCIDLTYDNAPEEAKKDNTHVPKETKLAARQARTT